MPVVLYVVRRGPDDESGDRYTFLDRVVAEQAAAIVGGWIELEPLMDAGALRELRATTAPTPSGPSAGRPTGRPTTAGVSRGSPSARPGR